MLRGPVTTLKYKFLSFFSLFWISIVIVDCFFHGACFVCMTRLTITTTVVITQL